MLEQLIQLTNSENYKQNGGMRITEVLIRPWDENEIKIKLETFIDDPVEEQLSQKQIWQITCKDIMYNTSSRIHEPKIPHTQIKLFTEHPVLWNYGNSIYFSINGVCDNISEVVGDLFSAHDKACGNWVDFHWLFASLPETLKAQRRNQFAVPEKLFETYSSIFKAHQINVSINEHQKGEDNLAVLFFSNPNICSDEYSFGQPYLVAKKFEETKIK